MVTQVRLPALFAYASSAVLLQVLFWPQTRVIQLEDFARSLLAEQPQPDAVEEKEKDKRFRSARFVVRRADRPYVQPNFAVCMMSPTC